MISISFSDGHQPIVRVSIINVAGIPEMIRRPDDFKRIVDYLKTSTSGSVTVKLNHSALFFFAGSPLEALVEEMAMMKASAASSLNLGVWPQCPAVWPREEYIQNQRFCQDLWDDTHLVSLPY